MKKVYMAPALEIEIYELDANIANHCDVKVLNGPGAIGHEQCLDFPDPFLTDSYSIQGNKNVNFYDDQTCDCYTSGGNGQYWTS